MTAQAHTPLYTVAEEIAHAVTHGLGALLSACGLVALVVLASMRGDAWHVIGCAVFGTTLVLLYAASTLYHAIPSPRAKRVFQRLDHAAIFLLIAGT
jgi:hemolysin III